MPASEILAGHNKCERTFFQVLTPYSKRVPVPVWKAFLDNVYTWYQSKVPEDNFCNTLFFFLQYSHQTLSTGTVPESWCNTILCQCPWMHHFSGIRCEQSLIIQCGHNSIIWASAWAAGLESILSVVLNFDWEDTRQSHVSRTGSSDTTPEEMANVNVAECSYLLFNDKPVLLWP